MERIGKRRKSAKSVLPLTICLTAVLLLVCLAAVWLSDKASPMDPLEGSLPGNADSSQTEESISGDFAYRISGEIYIQDGVGDILLENPAENACAFSVAVILVENDQILAQTPILSPGQHLLRTPFQNLPDKPGYYAAEALFQVYSQDSESLLGEYRCSIKLHILEPS